MWVGAGTFPPKIVINLPRTSDKLRSCKGEPYRFTGQRDPSLHTERHIDSKTPCYFYTNSTGPIYMEASLLKGNQHAGS